MECELDSLPPVIAAEQRQPPAADLGSATKGRARRRRASPETPRRIVGAMDHGSLTTPIAAPISIRTAPTRKNHDDPVLARWTVRKPANMTSPPSRTKGSR